MLLSTDRTNLCGGLKAVNFDYALAPLEGYPFQHVQELPKTQVAHLASPQGFHTREVQILKVQHIVFIAQLMRQLEMMVKPRIRHMTAVPCQRSSCPSVTF